MTLIEAFNVSREQVIGTAVDDPGAERLEAEFALVGGHVDDADARFTQARVRFRNLDLWAHMPGIEVEIGADGRETVVRSKRPEPLSTSLTRPAGQLIVESNTPMPQLTVRGATLLRNTTLRFQSEADGLTIQELWAQLVNPISVLISLAVDADSPPVSLEVRTLSGDWLNVVHPLIAAADTEHPRHLLLWREQLDLSMIGNWLSKADDLSPVPQLVAGVALSHSDRTLENQLLELATAAEGLHRRLYREQRSMDRAKAKTIQRDASDAVPEEVRQLVKERLGHLEEPTYRDRLYTLIERAGDLTSMLGDANAWVAKITPARNGFAHRLISGREASALDGHFVLLRSLRWFLTSLLLLEAGVEPAVLRGRLDDHQPYLHFLRQARRWLPDVYG